MVYSHYLSKLPHGLLLDVSQDYISDYELNVPDRFPHAITCFDREEAHPSDFSSSSSDTGAMSPVEMLEGQNVHPLEKQSSTER